MKKVSILLLFAIMLLCTGITAKPSEKAASACQVSKNDVPVLSKVLPNVTTTDATLITSLIQYDVYYVETITHSNFYQDNATEAVYREVETPPPIHSISLKS